MKSRNIILLFLLGCLIGGVIAILYFKKDKQDNNSSPVEEIMIDSTYQENAKLIIEVEYLDSIKDAKVIEVKSLDNDSTLKLFYQLISK